MVICLERGADLHMAQLMPLPLTVFCFSEIKISFTLLVPAHPGSPGQRAVKRVCVFVLADIGISALGFKFYVNRSQPPDWLALASRRENRTCVPNARVDVFWNRVHCPITTRHSTQAEVTSTLSIYLSIYLSVCLSVYLSIYLSIYLADGQQNLSNFVLISKRVGVFIGAKQHAVAGALRYTPDPHLQPTERHTSRLDR